MFWFLLKLFIYLLISGLLFFLLGWRLRGKRASALVVSKERQLEEERNKRERNNELLVRAEADRDRSALEASKLRSGGVEKSEFDKLQTEFTSVSMELSRLRDERLRSNEELEGVTGKLTSVEEVAHKATRERDDLLVELEHLRSREATLSGAESDTLSALRHELDEKNKALALAIDEKEALEHRPLADADADGLRRSLESAQTALREADEERDALREQLAKSSDSADLVGMRRMLNDAKVALGQSVSELTDSKTRVRELEARLEEKDAGPVSARELSSQRERVNDLELALAKSKKQASESQSRVEALEADARKRGASGSRDSGKMGNHQALKSKVETLQSQLKESGGSDEKLQEERDQYKAQLELLKANLATQAAFATGDKEPDDLTRIKGVGAVLSHKLNSYGIYTYQQIMEWDSGQRDLFDELLAFAGRIQRDRWQEQARTLFEEKESAGVS